MAPLTMCLGWRCSRVMCLSSRHSWFCARCCPSQGGLYIDGGTATLSDCQLTSNSAGCAWSVCRRVVRQLHVNRTCTEHETILKAKALRLSNAHVPPLSSASCVLRSCDRNRYVVTADATWHQNRCCPSQGVDLDGSLTGVRGMFVDASSASCVPIEHAPSTTILKAKALRLSNARAPPLSPASCVLRSCDPNRYVATAAMDAT